MSGAEPKLVEVRIPRLRGVSVAVLVDRAVWAYFDRLEGAVRRHAAGAFPSAAGVQRARHLEAGWGRGARPRRLPKPQRA